MVVNRLSPVTTRLPADSSLSNMPPSWPACEPSPNTVSICTAESFYISPPASDIDLSPVSSSSPTNCITPQTPRSHISPLWPPPKPVDCSLGNVVVGHVAEGHQAGDMADTVQYGTEVVWEF